MILYKEYRRYYQRNGKPWTAWCRGYFLFGVIPLYVCQQGDYEVGA
jgi:hypothetical protein